MDANLSIQNIKEGGQADNYNVVKLKIFKLKDKTI